MSRVRAEGALRRALRAQDLPSSCPSLEEESIMSRLQAAWTLRSDATLAMNFVSVRYEALPELSTFLVMTPKAARRWGETQDFQDLADRLQIHFPLGILVLEHSVASAFHFYSSKKPGLEILPRALRYAAKWKDCLLMARVQCGEEK